MKKIIIYLLVILIMLSGCGFNDTDIKNDNNESNKNEGKDVFYMDNYDNYWKTDAEHGLRVDGQGSIVLGGRKFYGAGVNCYNLFLQCINDYDTALAQKTLDVLKENDIKFVRFSACVYYYDELYKYENNKDKFLATLKEVFKLAEEREIGLIPSFFWHSATIPDNFDEPFKAWGNISSKTTRFLVDYTTTLINNIKDYKSVWGYEFGNEFALACDLPNAKELLINSPMPTGSSRAKRDETDYLSVEDLSVAYELFSSTVKQTVKNNILISSGDATIRPSQYNQYKYKTWEQDTRDERTFVTKIITPTNLNTISEHIYFLEQTTFGEKLSVKDYIFEAQNIAKTLGKAYIVGEWGGGVFDDYENSFNTVADAIVQNKIQLSMVWNYNYANSIEHSFTADTNRGNFILGLTRKINNQLNEYKGKY